MSGFEKKIGSKLNICHNFDKNTRAWIQRIDPLGCKFMKNHAAEGYNPSSIKYTMTDSQLFIVAGSLAFVHGTRNINHIDSLKQRVIHPRKQGILTPKTSAILCKITFNEKKPPVQVRPLPASG